MLPSIQVYHSYFQPLEFTVAGRAENACYLKLICNLADNVSSVRSVLTALLVLVYMSSSTLLSNQERVLGFHVVGPNAGEITQGYGVAMKLRATKADFDATIGIHPTCSEKFTTLTATKRSGVKVEESGC